MTEPAAPTDESLRGLTSSEVATRVAAGHVNEQDQRSSRRLSEIIRANVLTRFNAIIGALMAVVLALGEPRDALFGFVMILNIVIGVTQEWRAKLQLDRLSIVGAPSVTVRRDGQPKELRSEQVVLDDVLELSPGDQVVVDGEVVEAEVLSVDESLLTGESDAVHKHRGDEVMSGSFVVAGGGVIRATSVGDDSYAARLTQEAKKFQAPTSELSRGIDRILRIVTWAIVPIGVIVYLGQRASDDESTRETLIGTVAALVALVPQGLVLLLSLTQAVAVIRLARQNVLVQQLRAVETLARVTVLATDKTGTLTTGQVGFDRVEVLSRDGMDVPVALAAVAAADEFPNATMRAVQDAYPSPPSWVAGERIPFDSTHKYSAVDFGADGSWYIGAPEVLLAEDAEVEARVAPLAAEGRRVLVLARATTMPPAGTLPDDLGAQGLVLFDDEIRPDAADTIDYFLRIHVVPKVISGDNPATVSAIAARCHVPNADRFVDARELPTDGEALAAAVEETAVFGRVTPELKRSLLHALQARGHVVAMTGDGVNDTLALKDADLGIAMGSGTPAAKSVSQLVLVDDRFSTLPSVVAEGRRVIANIERVARLFVTKSVWAAVLAVLTGILATKYPFRPRHLTVIDALTIGIPGFVLSFQPSDDPARPGFLRRVLRFAVPAGVVAGAATMVVYELGGTPAIDVDTETAQSGATMALTALGLWALYEATRPLDRIRVVLLAALVVMGVGAFTIPFVADFFLLEVPPSDYLAAIAVVTVAAAALMSILVRLVAQRVSANPRGG